jgi:peptide/nickel transport system ATP-binding protein
MSNILNVNNLSVKVNNTPLINNISFEIQRGEIFSLVGESGSGKSLTSLAVMRLLPEALQITSGDILLDGHSLFSISELEMQKVRGRKIAMIFQEPMTALNPVMTIGEQVAEVMRLHLKLPEKRIQTKVIELFEEVGLKDAKQRYHWYPHQLSGGQKQRVMISMALACEPELLIADEPTTALDVTIQAQVLALLKEIQTKRSLSILFITHDMGVVDQMADTVAVMKNGEIVEIAQKEAFFEQPQHEYSQKLLADALPSKVFKMSESESNKLLELKDLKVHFPIKKGFLKRTVGYTKAVDGVSFSIPKGKTLAVVGESGSGKSTVGNAILRLLEITEGEIRFNGVDLSQLSQKALREYRRKIQIVFQDPYSALNPRMTVGEIIREGMVSLKVGVQDKNVQDMVIKDLLVDVGLEFEHFYRYPHEFSGGQRQRIGIARALAVEPQLIICDEPTSALDVSVRAQVLKLLKKLQKERGLSYLFITHDLSIVPIIADEVAVMKEGRLVEFGSTEEVMREPKEAYTQQLLAAAPRLITNS